MKLRSRTTIAVTAATLAIAAGTGGALAAGGSGGGGADGAPGVRLVAGPGGGPARVAAYLGLTEPELRAQLEAGKSLAQIASAQGKSVAGLEDVILGDAKTHLDEAVANGRLTAAQEEAMLDDLRSHVDEIVNATGRGGGVRIAIGPPFGTAAAAYLGLAPEELRAQLAEGKTLAQIASAQGKSLDGVKAAILAGAKERLDQAVAAGKLTAAQAQTRLAGLQERLDEIVSSAGPLQRAYAGRGGGCVAVAAPPRFEPRRCVTRRSPA
jgi:hypothetical protein